MKPVILASASPRRSALLEQIGIKAEIRPGKVDETPAPDHLTPGEVVEELSAKKAEAAVPETVLHGDPECIIIGADTVVSAHGKILGKPVDEEDACRMLRMLSGKRNIVYTGVTLLDVKDGQILARDTFSCATCVWFYPLTEEEIRSYVESGEPMDKAGAYGIQGIFGRYVERIEGDYNNVVGLPAGEVWQHLKRFGYQP